MSSLADSIEPVVRRLRVTVEYDGTNYQGFQRQPEGRTVQGVLEAALAAYTPTPSVLAAGRTDSGVHARGQVVHFDYAGRVPINKLTSIVNGQLPDDLALRNCREVAPTFNARYSALSRTYRYHFIRTAEREPLRERFAWRLPGVLDVAAMQEAVMLLPGTHSFRHFGRIPGSLEQARRSQQQHGWRRIVVQAELTQTGDSLCFQIEANAYLTHMARAIVGTLVAVGRGRLHPAQVRAALLDETSDVALAPIAPAHGLVLFRVRYPDE